MPGKRKPVKPQRRIKWTQLKKDSLPQQALELKGIPAVGKAMREMREARHRFAIGVYLRRHGMVSRKEWNALTLLRGDYYDKAVAFNAILEEEGRERGFSKAVVNHASTSLAKADLLVKEIAENRGLNPHLAERLYVEGEKFQNRIWRELARRGWTNIAGEARLYMQRFEERVIEKAARRHQGFFSFERDMKSLIREIERDIQHVHNIRETMAPHISGPGKELQGSLNE